MRQREAKKILPKTEYETFETVLLNQGHHSSRSRLMQKATLARKLRDKYKDRSRREVAATKSRRTNEVDTETDNRRVRIYQELIERLEELLAEPVPSRQRIQRNPKASLKDKSQSLAASDRRAMLDARRRAR